ncbi:MAG: TonB-dependent receptor [Bacteroidales bacterium]|nr:TonB-dependent receptor [Bacteroidales bacterium]
MILFAKAALIFAALTAEVCNDIDTLETSIVRADRTSTHVPSQTLQGERLERLSTTTVADALKYFSGVQIKDYGGLGGQKTINVRSLGTQHTGVFIDGIRITNCQNGTVDLGKYSLANMESVELYNANKVSPLMTASEYASASTVYLTTKRPEGSSCSGRYSNGSFGSHRVQIHGSLARSFFADAEYQHSDGDYPFRYKSTFEDTLGIRRNSDITFVRSECGWFTDHLTAHLYFYDSERGLPGGVVQRISDKFGDVGRERDINTFAQLAYRNTWGDHSLRVNTRYAYDFLHADSDFEENMFVHFNNRYHQRDAYLGAAYSYLWNGLTLSFSPDFRVSDLECDVYGLDYVYRTDFKSSAGAAWSWRGLSLFSSLLYTGIQDHSSMPVADYLSKLSPNVHISYRMGDITLRAFYKNVFRAPTLNDLYYTHVGKRDLKPEQTSQIDCGASFDNGKVNFQIDGYCNEAWDKIVCIPQGGSYNWKMMNRGRVRTFGADASVRAAVKDFSFFLTATRQDVRDLSDPADSDTYNHILLYSPEWSFTAVAGYARKGFSATVSHLYCSSRFWTYADPDDVLPPYNCTDAKIQYEWKWFTFSAECQDIFDIRYEMVQRWPMPGRRFQFTILFKI